LIRKVLQKLREKLKRISHKEQPVITGKPDAEYKGTMIDFKTKPVDYPFVVEKLDKEKERLAREQWLPPPPPPRPRVRMQRRQKPRSTAVHRDIGKFMKHGRQLKEYRQSVKRKVQPEED